MWKGWGKRLLQGQGRWLGEGTATCGRDEQRRGTEESIGRAQGWVVVARTRHARNWMQWIRVSRGAGGHKHGCGRKMTPQGKARLPGYLNPDLPLEPQTCC